ncbi:hypothetical protein RB195_017976 [Necator americanus]|uniref:Reverse transcriptase domain-containing protein n=1 Tax=Necator americanus TaxID=51031 RepID=A0ABR1C7L4_NECAM
MEKNICYRQRRRKEVVYDDCVLEDFLSQGDWHIEEDANVDYEMLLRGLRACAERASKPRTTNLDRISKTTKELLERRRALRLDPNASHTERLVANTSCRKALQEDLLKYRQNKILEAAQRRTTLKKCRRDLREYNIPLATLLSEDGTRTSSRREMEIITERFYSNLFRSSTPMSSPIIPTGKAALQWIMKSLSWEERGIRVDGRFLSNLRFADDIVAFSSSTNEAETMPNELNEVGKRIGLRINRKKTQFMKNAHCEDGGVQLEGFQIVETPSYVYLGRSLNMKNDLNEELNKRMRAAWAAFAAVREATGQLTDHDPRAHLFDSTVLPSLCYAAETWADTAATSRKLFTTHRALERCLLKFNRRTQHLAGLRSSHLRGMSRLRDPTEYVSKAKHRWAGHIMRRIDGRWTER